MKLFTLLATAGFAAVSSINIAQAEGQSKAQANVVEVFKSPTCGCCSKWVEHLREAGFQVSVSHVINPSATRRRLGIADRYGSCHTASVGGYAIEGHVPAADIKRLLTSRPKAVGLAVASMPPGSPDMESANPVPYETVLVQADGGAQVYARH